MEIFTLEQLALMSSIGERNDRIKRLQNDINSVQEYIDNRLREIEGYKTKLVIYKDKMNDEEADMIEYKASMG